MKKRISGTSSLEVSEIGLGCMGMNFGYGTVPEKGEIIALIHQAVESGVTDIRTAVQN